jgi:phasin family protein
MPRERQDKQLCTAQKRLEMLRRNHYVALQQRGFQFMTDQLTTDAGKIADATAKTVEAAAKPAAEVAKATVIAAAKTADTAAKAIKAPRKTKRRAASLANARATKAAKRTVRKTIKINNAAAPKRAAQKRIETMTNYDFFKGFDALPTFAPFQEMINKAKENGQQFAKKGQKVAEELADLARANVEAMVEAGRVASEGAKALGQDAVSTSRDGFEKAADAIRTLAEAKSPTEYLQLQGEFARASFDRMVAEGSKMTETMVKLAGQAFQPIQNRAAANAERFNTFVA